MDVGSGSPPSQGPSPAMTFASEGIVRGEIAAAQAEVEVLRVQVRNLQEELSAKVEEARQLRDSESEEVVRLRGLIGEKLGGRQQQAQYLNETSTKLHDMLQEKDARLHSLSTQILELEQVEATGELVTQELTSRLALATHQASASDSKLAALRSNLTSAHEDLISRSATLHAERAAHTRNLQALSNAMSSLEASLLAPLLPSLEGGGGGGGVPPTAPTAASTAPFSWLSCDACVLTIGKGGGGPLQVGSLQSIQTSSSSSSSSTPTHSGGFLPGSSGGPFYSGGAGAAASVTPFSTLYVTVRDAGMRLMRLPESAEIHIRGRGCSEDAEADRAAAAAAAAAAGDGGDISPHSPGLLDHQLLLEGYGGLCIAGVSRISRSTWEVSAYVDSALLAAAAADAAAPSRRSSRPPSRASTPRGGPAEAPGCPPQDLVTSSQLLKQGRGAAPPPPHRNPPPPPPQGAGGVAARRGVSGGGGIGGGGTAGTTTSSSSSSSSSHPRVGVRLIAAENICLSSRTFAVGGCVGTEGVRGGGGGGGGGGGAATPSPLSTPPTLPGMRQVMRHSDVFVFPDPLVVLPGGPEGVGVDGAGSAPPSAPPSPTSAAGGGGGGGSLATNRQESGSLSHMFLKAVLTLRDARGRCTAETDTLSQSDALNRGLECSVFADPSSPPILRVGVESFIPVECGVLALCRLPSGRSARFLQGSLSAHPLSVEFAWRPQVEEEALEEAGGRDTFNDALFTAPAAEPAACIASCFAVRGAGGGSSFAADVSLRARFIQTFLARGLHAVLAGRAAAAAATPSPAALHSAEASASVPASAPHAAVVNKTLERIATLHRDELLDILLQGGAVVQKGDLDEAGHRLEETTQQCDAARLEAEALRDELLQARGELQVACHAKEAIAAELQAAQDLEREARQAADAAEAVAAERAADMQALQGQLEEALREGAEGALREQALAGDAEALREERQGSGKEVAELTGQLSALEAAHAVAVEELGSSAARDTAAEAKLEKQQAQLAELQGLCSEMEKRFREVASQHAARVRELQAAAEATEEGHREQVSSLQEALGNSSRSNGREMEKLATRIADLTSSAERIVREHEQEMQTARLQWQHGEQALRDKVSNLETSLEGVDAEKRRGETRLRMLSEEIGKWEAQAEGLAQQAEQYAQRVAAADERIRFLEAELESAVEEANSISVEWGRAQSAGSEMQQNLLEQRSANQAVSDSLVNTEQQLRGLQGSHEGVLKELEAATARLDVQNAAVADLKAEVATGKTAAARHEKEVEKLKAEVAGMESHASTLRIDLEAAQAKHDTLVEESAALRGESKNAARRAEQAESHLQDVRRSREVTASQAEADLEGMQWELQEARAEASREAAKGRALERDMDFLLSQVDYARSALFGVAATEELQAYRPEEGVTVSQGVAVHALMAEHATGVRLIRGDQELQFAKISHLFHNALGALARNALIEQNAAQKDRLADLKRELTETQIVLDSRMSELSLLRDQVTFAKQSAEAKIESEEAWRRRSDTRSDELEADLARVRKERSALEGECKELEGHVRELKGQLNEEIRLRVRLQDDSVHQASRDTTPRRTARDERDADITETQRVKQLQQMIDTLKSERRIDAQQYARLKAQLQEERNINALAESKMRSAKDLAASWEASVQSQHQTDMMAARKHTYQAESQRAELEHKLLVSEKKLESLHLDLKMQKQRAASSEMALKEANQSLDMLREQQAAQQQQHQQQPAERPQKVRMADGGRKRKVAKSPGSQISAFLDISGDQSTARSTPRPRSTTPVSTGRSPGKSPSIATHYANIS